MTNNGESLLYSLRKIKFVDFVVLSHMPRSFDTDDVVEFTEMDAYEARLIVKRMIGNGLIERTPEANKRYRMTKHGMSVAAMGLNVMTELA